MPHPRFFITATVLVLVAVSVRAVPSSLRQDTEVSEQFINAVNPKREAVVNLAAAVQGAFRKSNWCASAAQCNNNCFYHDCDGRAGLPPDAICTDKISACNCPVSNSATVARALLLGKAAVRQTPCDICEAYEDPTKRLLNYERPNFRTPPGSIRSEGNNASIVVNSHTLRRDLCALKTIGEDIRTAHTDNDLKAWLYVGTTNGAFMKFPGAPFCRDESSSDPLMTCSYDPTGRPWYITAATGPRDIVFMYDDKVESDTPLHAALLQTLKQLDARDAVSLQTFGSSSVTPVGSPDAVNESVPNPSGLNFAIPSVRDGLHRSFEQLQVGGAGQSNLTLALETAFDVISKPLSDDEPTSECERYIVLMVGSEDSCFSECSTTRCDCVAELQALVDERQTAFGGKPVSLVVFTQERSGQSVEAVSNMERIGSTIACPTGLWSRVDPRRSNNAAMTAFPKFGAFLLFDSDSTTRNVFSSSVYTDAAGLGRMFTLAIPIYDVETQNLVAVAGADITVAEVREDLPEGQDAEAEIELYSKASRECTDNPKNVTELLCETNALRQSLGSSKECPDPVRSTGGVCAQFGSSTRFRRGETARLSFAAAQAACKSETDGGTLAVLDSQSKNRFFTSLAAVDGTWIGLRAQRDVNDSALGWVTGDPLTGDYAEYGFDMNATEATAEFYEEGQDEACVSADRRGATGNWNVMPCNRELPYVCEVPLSSTVCDDNTDDSPRPSCAPTTDSFRCSQEQRDRLDEADPLCKQSGKDMSEAERKCCGNLKGTDDLGGNSGEEDGGVAGWLIGVIVGAAAACVTILLVWFFVILPRRRQTEGGEENVHDGSHGGEDADSKGGLGQAEAAEAAEVDDDLDVEEELDMPVDDPFTPAMTSSMLTTSGPRSSDETFNPQGGQAAMGGQGEGRRSDDTFNPLSEPAPMV